MKSVKYIKIFLNFFKSYEKVNKIKKRCILIPKLILYIYLLPYIFLIAKEKKPDLIPMPKVYKQIGGIFDFTKKIMYIEKNNSQCNIAADEINKRIIELGGHSLPIEEATQFSNPGIYILPYTNKIAHDIIRKLSLKIDEKEPGPQGYIILSEKNRLIIIGSDNIGTLYGAMTLRQMIECNEKKIIYIQRAYVYDKPDYRYRSTMSFLRGLEYWTTGERKEDKLEGYKRGIDWLMRFKINIIDDYIFANQDIRDFSEDTRNFIREVNNYAIERGIYPVLWQRTSLGMGKFDKEKKEFQNWDCVYVSGNYGDFYYCWSRDRLAIESINRVLDFVKECNFKILVLHPVDGGGIIDPELWSQRCNSCKQRFGDARWEASIHQFNMWADAVKKKIPDCKLVIPIYPYSPEYGDYSGFQDIKEEIWKKNSVDYWRKVNEGMDSSIIPLTWMSVPVLMNKYRECFKGRPIAIYAHCFLPAGYFGTWHRLAKTNYSGNSEDLFLLAGGNYGPWTTWMNVICTGEFAWNTDAPGSDLIKGIPALYYDMEKDFVEPEVIIKEWVPRACRTFFGKKIGDRIAPIFQLGIQPGYIQDPGNAISIANKYRKKPRVEISGGIFTGPDFELLPPPIEDSTERMAFQSKATEKAIIALEDVYPFLDNIDKYRKKTVMYFYKRMALWHMIAHARYSIYKARDFEKKRMLEEAISILNEGLKEFEKDLSFAENILEKTNKEFDLYPYDPLGKNGDVRPTPNEVKQLLIKAMQSLTTSLKPRPPEKVIKVGLYKGMGAWSTKLFLDNFQNVQSEIFDDLTIATIDKYDCVFIFQTDSVDQNEYFSNLVRYVKEGGRGVLFQHDMCGFRIAFGQKTPFPEICLYAIDREDSKNLVVNIEHPVICDLKKGEIINHMYYDHLILKPGPKGKVIMTNERNNPVVVIGEVGLGKVIFDGNINLNEKDIESCLVDFNAVLCKGAIEWFTGIKLIPK